jgi:hypothetical protein
MIATTMSRNTKIAITASSDKVQPYKPVQPERDEVVAKAAERAARLGL